MARRSSSQGTFLLVANYAPDVGFAWWLMESFWVQIADCARTSSLRPLLVYPKHGTIPDSIQQAEIEWEISPFGASGPAGLWRDLQLIQQHNVKAVYFTDRSYSSVRYLFYRLMGVRLIINHDHTPGDRPSVTGVRGALKSLWRRLPGVSGDCQFCVSPLIKERGVRNARIPESRLTVIQNGIAPIECDGDREYAARTLGLPRDRRICISVSRAVDYKRVDFIVCVASHCVQEMGIRDLVFVHCGDGPHLEQFKSQARQAGLEEHFHFAGRRSDIPQLLCSADYALHAARGEAFSLAVVEFMSAGLAVLVPSIPSVSQAITDGVSGLVYREGDVAHAATLLTAVHRDASRRTRLGKRAAETVRERYSADAMIQALRAAINELIDRRIGRSVS